jgi:hypothetical protein
MDSVLRRMRNDATHAYRNALRARGHAEQAMQRAETRQSKASVAARNAAVRKRATELRVARRRRPTDAA